MATSSSRTAAIQAELAELGRIDRGCSRRTRENAADQMTKLEMELRGISVFASQAKNHEWLSILNSHRARLGLKHLYFETSANVGRNSTTTVHTFKGITLRSADPDAVNFQSGHWNAATLQDEIKIKAPNNTYKKSK